MKKILIASICCLTACRIKPLTSGNATVEYKYNAHIMATYKVAYIDGNNKTVQSTFTGTSFSKTITVKKNMGFKLAQLSMIATDISPVMPINGDAEIIVNGRTANTQTVLLSKAGTQRFTIRDTVFN